MGLLFFSPGSLGRILLMHLSDFQTPDMQMTTLVAESKELKSLLMKVKEESEKASFFNIQETKIVASGPITSQQIDGETMETVRYFIFLGSKMMADGD